MSESAESLWLREGTSAGEANLEHPRGRRKLLAGWLLAVLTASASSAAPLAVSSGLSSEQRQLVIEKAYGRLVELTASSGTRVSVEITKPKTIDLGDFAHTRWLQLVTMPGGDMVDVNREERRAEGGVTAVLYRPTWNLDGESYVKTDEGQRLRGLSVADVLATAALDNPDFGRVEAITSYRVTVELLERTRSYRAIALWLAAEGANQGRVVFIDHITQGVAEAATERRLHPPVQRPLLIAGKTASCVAAENWNTKTLQTPLGTGGHAWIYPNNRDGFHYAYGEAKFVCDCESNCRSTCTSSLDFSICTDQGTTTDGCHVMAQQVGTGTVSKPDGLAGGASCAAGLGCVKKSCTFCMCSPGISVSVFGLNVSFTTSGSPDWTGNLSYQFTCNACIEVVGGGGDPEGPFDQDPGPGNPGGGGGGCCWWNTSCYVNSNGVYTCTPTTCGQWGC